MFTQAEKDQFINAYRECALWSSTDDKETPLDEEYSVDDIELDSYRSMERDCESFLGHNEDDIRAYCEIVEGEFGGMEMAGHDFWLTRNAHGAGFWDRGAGKAGTNLTRASHHFGECNLLPVSNHKLEVC